MKRSKIERVRAKGGISILALDDRGALTYVLGKKNPRGAVQAYSGVFEVQRRVFIGLGGV